MTGSRWSSMWRATSGTCCAWSTVRDRCGTLAAQWVAAGGGGCGESAVSLTPSPGSARLAGRRHPAGAQGQEHRQRDGPSAQRAAALLVRTDPMSVRGAGLGSRVGWRVEGGERRGPEALDGQVHADGELEDSGGEAEQEPGRGDLVPDA